MASKFSERLRKPIAAVGFGVRATANMIDANVPTVTSGTGVPSDSEPNGSIYLRTDSSDADTAIYARIGGAWVAMLGAS